MEVKDIHEITDLAIDMLNGLIQVDDVPGRTGCHGEVRIAGKTYIVKIRNTDKGFGISMDLVET